MALPGDDDGGSVGASREEENESSARRVWRLDAARWAAVLETARDAVISIDRDGAITLFNRSAEEIFGYRADEVLGRNVNVLMPVPYHEEHDSYLAHYHQTGAPRAIGRIRHVHGLRKSGEIFPIELSVSESRVGADVLYTAILRDVSERVRMQSELEAARDERRRDERLIDIGAITLKIAHDLGNPIAGIQMQVWRMLRRIERDPNQRIESLQEPLQQMSASIARLDGLIHEFKSFAREQRLDLGEIDVSEFLGDLVQAWTPEALSRGIDLSLAPLAGPRMVADGDKLRRVLDNLMKNALEAIDRGPGIVTMAATVQDERVRITVEDTGPGIPTDLDVFRLFETTKENGTGLGLPIAKQIVLAHGGEIVFGPRAGGGTTFRVDLPCDLRARAWRGSLGSA